MPLSEDQPEDPGGQLQTDGENPQFLQQQLITYLGNKRALLPFIEKGIEQSRQRLGKQKLVMLDLFSGSGIVSRFFKRFASQLITNDLETYSRVTNQCYLTNHSTIDHPQLRRVFEDLLKSILNNPLEGIITELYCPLNESSIMRDERVFYTRRNAGYLDTARQAIAKLDVSMQHYFLAPLLSDASVHANTSGVFKGFYKNKDGIGQFGGSGKNALSRIMGEIHLDYPIFSKFECDVQIHQADANTLVKQLEQVDLAYIDPPYNQHPYGSNYFMLNLLVDYQRPKSISRVSGIPKDWNRSDYNKRPQVIKSLTHLIESCPAKLILISYNSEGFISQTQMTDLLSKLGKWSMIETPYNTFRGSRNLRDRAIYVSEYLYLLER